MLTVEHIVVITADGRTLTGLLCGFDQTTNLIISDTEERIFSPEETVQVEPLGLYLLRGENVAIIGEVDPALEQSIDWEKVKGNPIKETKVFA
ncbi:hypothetical protein BCR37DRAFT_349310 [Protomyces lactucae-debilis]|uniref:LSM2-LSM8 complex subunit LSM8 n=1 Tax=Protomyces lactucae-debilis TaxID=2754530 RepID=A0A1Y2F8C4_PROLT|nr:uncharacterized protein BCR37DRAFT_349310 [Protomyces lactucae-debilis]ORY79887.1 hypothetical protein BCR37DRAFT_349310 [Protomyces lactucae-debilis]